MRVLDPTCESSPAAVALAPRPESLEGTTVGIISNGKEGTERFFAALSRELSAQLGVARVEVVVKGHYSAPAETELLDEATAWAAAITGVGD